MNAFTSSTTTSATATLAAFAANLKTADIPDHVLRKTEDLWVDWFGSAIAGHGSRPVETLTKFASVSYTHLRAHETG
jgi:2-methylcitrate dehydratase PrpD